MTEYGSDASPVVWKKFLSKHWRMAVLFIAAAVLVAIEAILVYLWFVGQAQLSGLVPATLNLWTMGHLLAFILNLVFWELVLVGIPAIVVAIIAYSAWKRIPAEERDEYKRGRLFRSSSKSRDSSNGISFLVTIAFIIKIFIDGNWNSPFSTWTFDYLVYSFVLALISVAIIIGIPAIIGGIWWLRRELSK